MSAICAAAVEIRQLLIGYTACRYCAETTERIELICGIDATTSQISYVFLGHSL